jgi:internalin A
MELALQRIREAKEQRLTRLDLGKCGLTKLPDELFELTWLEELILSDEWWEGDLNLQYKEGRWIKSSNSGLPNNIHIISSSCAKLIKLKRLVVGSGEDIIKLSNIESLKYLPTLERLDIYNTKVENLSPLKKLDNLLQIRAHRTPINNLSALKHIKSLKFLEIGFTKVSDLTPLKNLTQLENLQVSNTKVSDLTPLKDLTQLQQLDVSETQVIDLSPLKDLTQLQRLDVSETQLIDLSPLKDLTQLQHFQVSNTQVSDLLPLKDLTQLQWLDVTSTQVSDLSPLKDLTQLQWLNVTSTQVSDLSPLKDLTQLQDLNAYSTQVSDLTPLKNIIEKGIKVNWSTYEDGINIEGSPLSNPPIEIVKQGNEAILNYWKQLEEQGGSETINEAKLIIVGEGKSGKTTLFNKLIKPDYELETLDETHGINIHEGLEMTAGFRANLWDFGGQELQYMTHQFFLTPRALYVLMMDARAESPNLAYWFKIVSLLGKETDGEKVSLLLVFNKRKGGTGTNAYYEILKHYEQDFDYIPLEVDFSDNDGRWTFLKDTIQKRLAALPIVKNELPKQWIPIREALREEAKTRHYISTDRLAEICTTHKVDSETSQFQLTQYLHQLGSLLHFQNDPDLSDTVILSPQWAVEGVYTVLKSEHIKANNGKFKAEDIFHILKSKKYTHGDAQKILKLMSRNNFDVCYQSENGDYVAAQLLQDSAPPQYKWHSEHGVLQFRYQYPIMPKSLMSRLIVRMSDYIEVLDNAEIVWKKGAILRIEKDNQLCRVMMCEDDAESKSGLREIIIEVMGDIPYRKFALQKVRDEVEKIHKKWFKNIKVDEMVSCCCDDCRISKNPFKFALNRLLHLQNVKQKSTIGCQESGEPVSINHLLEGIYDKNEINGFSKDKSTIHIENYHQHGGQTNIADDINDINNSK